MQSSLTTFGHQLRLWLDRLYLFCGYIAAASLIVILALVTLQMLARWTGEIFPGSAEYAGYFMAASTFFAFAYCLNSGSHIRVNILLNAFGKHRRWLEIWCLMIASGLAIFWAYNAVKSVYWSYKLNDISQGLDATPIWIPQLAMAAGSAVFALALVDHLIQIVFFGSHAIRQQAIGQMTE